MDIQRNINSMAHAIKLDIFPPDESYDKHTAPPLVNGKFRYVIMYCSEIIKEYKTWISMKVKLMFLFILGQPNRIEATMDILSIPSLDEIKEVTN